MFLNNQQEICDKISLYYGFLKSFFFVKNCSLLISKLQEKASALKREHPAPTFFFSL